MTKLCPHRGHALEPSGRCPYHGLCSPGPSVFQQMPLKTVPYTNEVMERIARNKGDTFQFVETRVMAPVALWLQNTMDPNHLRAVHGRGFERQFAHHYPYDIEISDDGNQSSYRMRVREDIVRSYRSIIGDCVSDFFSHAIEGPNLSVTSFLDVFYSIEVMNEISPSQCLVLTKYFIRKGIDVPRMLLDQATVANLNILGEDKTICESWAKTYKRGLDDQNWLRGEERIKAYVRHLHPSQR